MVTHRRFELRNTLFKNADLLTSIQTTDICNSYFQTSYLLPEQGIVRMIAITHRTDYRFSFINKVKSESYSAFGAFEVQI